jgi:hypothetical protein
MHHTTTSDMHTLKQTNTNSGVHLSETNTNSGVHLSEYINKSTPTTAFT